MRLGMIATILCAFGTLACSESTGQLAKITKPAGCESGYSKTQCQCAEKIMSPSDYEVLAKITAIANSDVSREVKEYQQRAAIEEAFGQGNVGASLSRAGTFAQSIALVKSQCGLTFS